MSVLFILEYSELSTSTVTQKQSVAYRGSTALLEFHLSQLAGDVETINIDDKKFLKVFKDITLKIDNNMVVMEVNEKMKSIIAHQLESFVRLNMGNSCFYGRSLL